MLPQRRGSVVALFLAWACALFSLALGCTNSQHPVHPVTGVVTYKGQPVAGAEVAFLPIGDDAKLSAASATTDANGRYALRTFFSAGDEVAGARPGEYHVTISKTELPPGELDPYKNPESQRPKQLLPEKYAEAKTSPERRTVEAKGNVFDFTLSD